MKVVDMTDMIFLQKEHFLCESKDVEILMYQINGKVFFNATVIHKSFGAPITLELNNYLRKDSARKLMLQMRSNLKGFDELLNEINKLSQERFKNGFKFKTSISAKSTKSAKVFEPFQDIDSFLAATNMLRLKQFDSQLEEGFVHSIKGAQGATFLCYDLFLDYCTHLSTELKLQVFETFKKFGDLNKLEGKDLAEALQKKAADELEKIPTFTPQVVARVVREEVKEKTKNLQQSIQDVFHSSSPPSKDDNMFAYIHDQINVKLFGTRSAKMHKIIELQKTSRIKLRDCMTDKAIRLLEQVESAVYVFLSDCYADSAIPSLDELDSVIEESCNAALSVARRRKDDFLVLQHAIEREYDLLVKNADCIKDLGVVPREDEVCDKLYLMTSNPSVKSLAITKQKSAVKKTSQIAKQPGPKQIAFVDQKGTKQENLQMSFQKDLI